MSHTHFSVRAVWDDEAGVYTAQSDIVGLHIEAATLEEFEAVMFDVVPDLLWENHVRAALATKPIKDAIPSWTWLGAAPASLTA